MIGWSKIVLYASLIIGIYYSTFEWLVFKDWSRDDYSYGVLIPFIVSYLIWEKKNFFIPKLSKSSWSGFLIFLPGVMFFWVAELAGEFFVLYFSSWLIVISLCWINMGLEKIKIISFPLFFSLTMFPLPNFINVKVTLGLKLLSSKIGVIMMQAYGMSAFREGNVIDLGFTKLQVVDACSGLRYLFPMIVLSILIAYFYKARFWKKVIVVLSSIPLTIFTNALRIALTGVLSEKYGSKVVDGFFHDFEGWFIFMITLGVLLGEIWALKTLFPEAQKVKSIQEEKRAVSVSKEASKQSAYLRQPQFIVSVVLLGLTLVLSKGVEFREAVPMSRSFSEFPMKIGGWEGHRQQMEKQIIDALNFSDYIMADYTDKDGRSLNFYVAYYESQRKGESIHSPATCLRGGGWNFQRSGAGEVPLKDGSSLPVNQALIEKAPTRQLSYYWFPSRDRILTNAFQMKWYNFWDALTRQRTDGALVRVITMIYLDENLDEVEKRIKSFIADVQPVLKTFLPK